MTTSSGSGSVRSGPLALLLGLFSNVWLGVFLMTVMFVYSWIGSAGLPIYVGGYPWQIDAWVFEQMRQWPGLEMTEYEWFNWWPFNLLIGLICANITVTTLRRIKLNAINLGVWMIHTGILVLCLGSYMYFSTKVEGDSPVLRRRVVATVPGGATVDFPAVPNASARAMGEHGMYSFFVSGVDPHWTLLSGPNKGQTAFAVQVTVDGPDDSRFMRQLIVNEPDATQDSIFSDGSDGGPPLQRAIKVLGRPLVDEQLQLSLSYAPQEWFYLANWVEKSWALYLREQGSGPWIQRPVDGLPLYNDYVGSLEEVWPPEGERLPARPLDVVVPPSEPGDPLPGVSLHIKSYLRYAHMEQRWVAGGSLNPTATVRLEDRFGEPSEYDLVAFDPNQSTLGRGFLAMRWARTEDERLTVAAGSDPILHVSVPGVPGELTHVIDALSIQDPDAPFIDVPGSAYSFRVQFMEKLDEPGLPGSIASVELRQGERRWRRFVSEDERFIRDVDAGDESLTPTETLTLDEGIVIHFHAPSPSAALTLVGGPGADELGLVMAMGSSQDGSYLPLALGETISLGGGESFSVQRFAAHGDLQTRPAVVPRRYRNRQAKEANARVRVQFDVAGELHDKWVSFHQYPIEGPGETMRRYWYQPTQVRLSDGRVIELLLSRERLPLPDPVVLDDFVIASHVGGFTGRTSSILNWTSSVRFGDGADGWGEAMEVSVNAPSEHAGLWYFQAQWDPPTGPMSPGDPGSEGLNYTVLGVGNRVGVGVQLLGSCIAVLGMLYAFYVKPILIKRRRRSAAAGAEVAA
ncbi:MAG: hypothetical protein DRQ55_02915 [Planctomycetota bacterium]|nr:MAG: hypothetical protein DRQ55_02915 [Planctomycetota bacterium]